MKVPPQPMMSRDECNVTVLQHSTSDIVSDRIMGKASSPARAQAGPAMFNVLMAVSSAQLSVQSHADFKEVWLQ